jgi:hypothetical protein
MTNKIRLGLAAVAVFGMVSANPVFAAGATRKTGAETTWRCAKISDEVLKLDGKYVFVDEAGRVVVDPKGAVFACNAPDGSGMAKGGGFPFEILLGALGLGGLLFAIGAGGGGNDSTG